MQTVTLATDWQDLFSIAWRLNLRLLVIGPLFRLRFRLLSNLRQTLLQFSRLQTCRGVALNVDRFHDHFSSLEIASPIFPADPGRERSYAYRSVSPIAVRNQLFMPAWFYVATSDAGQKRPC
jgi:hypothetical protein